MRFDPDTDWYAILDSGRRVYVCCGTMCPREGTLVYGCDGEVNEAGNPPFTPEERRDIADHYIARWIAWREEGTITREEE